MDIAQDIQFFVEDTNIILKEYNVMKVELNSENKKLKELCVSYDNIATYLSNIDLREISEKLEEKKNAMSVLSLNTINREDLLKQKKKECYEYMKMLHGLYQNLDQQNECTGDEIPDPFFVEMNKLLYPNNYDNHQIRSDPPIAGVFKSTNGVYTSTSSNLDDIQICSDLPDSGVFKCASEGHARR